MWRVAPHYSTLLKINADNFPQVTGDLAKSWTVSPDNLSYRFTLHSNVKFHDGSTLTSADVKASFDRLRNPPAGVVSLRQGMLADVNTIETPDDNTVIFTFKRKNAAALQLLAPSVRASEPGRLYRRRRRRPVPFRARACHRLRLRLTPCRKFW